MCRVGCRLERVCCVVPGYGSRWGSRVRGGRPRLAAAGARRPPRPPPPRLAGFRPLPCGGIGIHASAMVVVLMLCHENVRVVTGVVLADRSVRTRNASRRRKIIFHIEIGWIM